MDRHHPGNDRALDPQVATVIGEAQEGVAVIEHLSDDEVGPGVALFFEKAQILSVALGFDVAFGIAGHGDAKVIAMLGTDEAHQLGGVGEAAVGRVPAGGAPRGIAAQGEDVLDAALAAGLEGRGDDLHRHVGAGEVQHGLQPEQVLNVAGDLQRQLGSAPSRAPGDIDEGGREVGHALDAPVEVLDSRRRLRREVFERLEGLVRVDGTADLVDDLHRGRGGGRARREVGGCKDPIAVAGTVRCGWTRRRAGWL